MGSELQLLFLLLPVAALWGYFIGRSGNRQRQWDGDCPDFSRDYFRGLNYVLNEQPDQAIEVFVRMVEVDSDTVDTHFALAQLFRRRGETERAIRIHQNLIARPSLSALHRDRALFELGRDYMSAGLLDRAESLFGDLVDNASYAVPALQQLREIFEQERDWHRSITITRRLESKGVRGLGAIVAHYYCEIAETRFSSGESGEIVKLVKRALSSDSHCVRASLIEARYALRIDNPKQALRALKRVEKQDAAYLPEILALLDETYSRMGARQEHLQYLQELLRSYNSPAMMLEVARLIEERNGASDAARFVADYLRKRPSLRAIKRLLELTDTTASPELALVDEAGASLLAGKAQYRCKACGFSGQVMHWHCPSCKSWNTVKPITDAAADEFAATP